MAKFRILFKVWPRFGLECSNGFQRYPGTTTDSVMNCETRRAKESREFSLFHGLVFRDARNHLSEVFILCAARKQNKGHHISKELETREWRRPRLVEETRDSYFV